LDNGNIDTFNEFIAEYGEPQTRLVYDNDAVDISSKDAISYLDENSQSQIINTFENYPNMKINLDYITLHPLSFSGSGEIFYITDSKNRRVYSFSLPDAKLSLVDFKDETGKSLYDENMQLPFAPLAFGVKDKGNGVYETAFYDATNKKIVMRQDFDIEEAVDKIKA